MQVQLTDKEKEIIRKAAELQQFNLTALLEENENMEVDLTMFLIEHELDKDKVKALIKEALGRYVIAEMMPEKIWQIWQNVDFKMFKHILTNYMEEPEFDSARASLWRKMNLADELTQSPKN